MSDLTAFPGVHPDFRRIVEVLRASDAGATDEAAMDAMIDAICDIDALAKVALIRAAKIAQTGGTSLALISTGWMDGFLAGARFQQLKGSQTATN